MGQLSQWFNLSAPLRSMCIFYIQILNRMGQFASSLIIMGYTENTHMYVCNIFTTAPLMLMLRRSVSFMSSLANTCGLPMRR